MIAFSRPALGDPELRAVAEAFDSGTVGYGPRSRDFEGRFARHLGVPPEHVVFLNSATSGTFLALELLGLTEGDEVVIPSLSFVSGPNATRARGARPVFCEVDPRSLNPSVRDVERVLTPRTKAVLVLHYGGCPGDIAGLAELCARRGVALVEDAACSVASSVRGRAAGTFGDMGVWSFDQMKIMVTGDGGMLHVRDPRLARRARRLAYHGLARPDDGFTPPPWRSWEFEQREIGRRLVGNDLTAAIGAVQLCRLPGLVARREELVRRYDDALAGAAGIRRPPPLPGGHVSSHYLYWVQVDRRIRDEVARRLHAAGVETSFRYGPLHTVPAYGPVRSLPVSERAAAETLCLPLHPGLTDDDARTVAHLLRETVRALRPRAA
ncbi:DegT/DnrJ/EryC1/StrS family aminotransferase [Streptomyces roseoverticillatus]|uniref:DegT/DnrJ/EryC1/StrS family aminotransferase n=1 Tax=Streptomyces roseoverticillatus TaxID=66429 RepID=UPI0004C1075E|nr:DegT/DnrJ/EryC1/StrS family aminotransferase [Streptomyces roseoverticillatus]